jgi:hypothetical protein
MKRVAIVALALAARGVDAKPLRLRADALATTASPAGLLVLDTDTPTLRNGAGLLSAEAVVWIAASQTPGDEQAGDVLVIVLDARDAKNRARARVGRFVSTLGALRATHLDGAALRVALPYRLEAQAVGGVPVMPGATMSRSVDWLAGGRISRKLGSSGSVGIAYAQRRDAGQLADEEVGIDAGYAFSRRADAGARFAYDVASPGVSEVMVTTGLRDASTKTELYAIHRVASRLLPANSLFSVLGDVPSQRIGTLLTWKAAPRLDVSMDLGMRRIADTDAHVNDVGAEIVARARLRLDERGVSLLGCELRRGGVGDGAWVGARGMAQIKLSRDITLASELELVRPDDARRGSLWPWALVAAGWERGEWAAAIATEASSTAEYRYRFDVLAQLARTWGGPR